VNAPPDDPPVNQAHDVDVTVLLFATLKDLAGTGCLRLAIPGGAPVRSVWERLPQPIPSLPQPDAVRFSLNDAWVTPDTPIAQGDRVGVILPVSGG